MTKKIKVAPSILSADFSRLGEEIKAVEAAGADLIHVDVMDGHFVPNITIGPLIVQAARKVTKLPLDVHLMIDNPELYIADFAKAGADYIDVAMEPLSWGMSHPDVITVQAMLKDAGFLVPEINMKAYMEARSMTQGFIDDFLGYFIDPGNKIMSSLLVGCGLPGGMMGSMMSDLKGMHGAINMALRSKGKREVAFNDLVVQLFDEVAYVWPKLGYPPLVTPFSQYVKNIALMNIFSIAKGEPRFSQVDPDSRNMILGKTGMLPGELAPEIIDWVKQNGWDFYTGTPQDAYPDALDGYRAEMEKNGWDCGEDDEELFELAMHERQYRDYKSGVAKQRFQQELEQAREKAGTPKIITRAVVEVPSFDVETLRKEHPAAVAVQAPCSGQILWQIDYVDRSTPPVPGTAYKAGEPICWIQNYYGIEAVPAPTNGTILEVEFTQGKMVEKNQVLAFLE